MLSRNKIMREKKENNLCSLSVLNYHKPCVAYLLIQLFLNHDIIDIMVLKAFENETIK